MQSTARFVTLIAAAMLLLCATIANAQEYPTKPIRLIVPYGAGGLGDIAFRVIAPGIEKQLGQTLVIENKPGASGNIGAAEVARAAPDGYTLLIGAVNNFASNQFLYANMGFDPLAAFEPITLVANAPTIVVVNQNLPVQSMRELAAYAKANPGKLNFASPGVGTAPHLAAEYFANMAGVKMVHVPFNGSPPAVLALMRNEVSVAFYTYGPIASQLKSGSIRPLAVANTERLSLLPDAPTTAEAGFQELLTGSWVGLVAPRGTDAKILDRLNTAVRNALADPEVKKRYGEIGMIAGNTTRAEFDAFMRGEAARWKKVIDSAGIKKD